MAQVNAPGARGRGIGIAAGAAIGGGWAGYAITQLSPGNLAAVVPVWIITLVLVSAGLSLARQAKHQGVDTGSRERTRRAGRLYWLNVVGEIVALNIAVWVLYRVDGADYLIPTISIVVGLHFVPMARFFAYPLFYGTAAVMLVGAVVTIFATHGAGSPMPSVGYEAAANALILWTTAGIGWLIARR